MSDRPATPVVIGARRLPQHEMPGRLKQAAGSSRSAMPALQRRRADPASRSKLWRIGIKFSQPLVVDLSRLGRAILCRRCVFPGLTKWQKTLLLCTIVIAFCVFGGARIISTID
jgi:hypothetical protein